MAALPFIVDAISYAASAISLLFIRKKFQQDSERQEAQPVAATSPTACDSCGGNRSSARPRS